MASSCVMHWFFAFWLMCISHTLLSLSCCPHVTCQGQRKHKPKYCDRRGSSGSLQCSYRYFCPTWRINYAKRPCGLRWCLEPVAGIHGDAASSQTVPRSAQNRNKNLCLVASCWRRNHTKWFVRHRYNSTCQIINRALYVWLALMKVGGGETCKISNKKALLSNPEFLATFDWFTSCTTALHHQGDAL